MPDLRYLGTDVVRDLLVEAARTSNRSDFTFVRVRSLSIPEKANAADMVCFFSVGTHLLHEEFYVYLEEAKRVLKPDGVIVFSFLDVETPQGRSVLQSNVRHVKRGARPPHLDVFIGRSEIEPWADMLGLALVEIVPGDVPWTAPDHLTPYLSGPVVNAIHGQSTAVLRKLA
jgi:SAM-dependent methyltransferase